MSAGLTESAAQLQRARHLAEVGRLGDAAPLLQRLLADDPDDTEALGVLAYCLGRAGRYAEMLAVVEQAATLVPADPAVHRQRSRALLELGRTRAAVDAALQACRLDPQNFHSELVLAQALLAAGGTGNIVAAAAAGDRARRLAPDDPLPHIMAGDVLRRMAEFRRARQAYRVAVALDPENPLALYRLAAVDSDRGRALSASGLLGDTLRAAPNDPDVARTATRGARRALWLLTDVATVPLVLAFVAAIACRTQLTGTAGVLLASVSVLLGMGAAASFLRWRLGRLPAATRTLIRRNLWRVTFAAAMLRVVAIALGALLQAVDPVAGPDSAVRAVAMPLMAVPLILLLLRARNWFAAEFYYLLRRFWFRLRMPRPGA
jgi:tetratricopeptide (TPR) repeat protein